MMKFSTYLKSFFVIALSLFIGLTSNDLNAQADISFEAAEGYQLGGLSGQNGWGGGTVPDTFLVSDEESSDGLNSVKMNSSGSGFNLLLGSPTFPATTADIVVTTINFYIGTTNGGVSEYFLEGSSTENDLAYNVYFYNDNTMGLLLRQSNGSFAVEVIPGFQYVRDTWFELKIENDFSGTAGSENRYYIDDQLVYADTEGNNAINLTQFIIGFRDNLNAGSAFIDAINAGPVSTGAGNSDACSLNALELFCGMTYLGDTTDNTDTGGVNDSQDEWFTFTGDGAGELVTLSLCTSSYDTVLTVYDACDGTVIATNDDFCGTQSQVNFNSDGITTYVIAVEGGATNEMGTFSLAVSCGGGDACEDAFPLLCGDVVSGTTVDNSDSGTNFTPDEWFSFTGNGQEDEITVSLCGGNSNYNTVVGVLAGECNVDPLIFNDDFCGLQSEVTFISDGTTTYYIFVDGANLESGNFTLEISCNNLGVDDFDSFDSFSFFPNPANDVVALASLLPIDAIRLYDITGNQIISETINTGSYNLNTSSLAQGMYIMKVTIDGATKAYKLIKA